MSEQQCVDSVATTAIPADAREDATRDRVADLIASGGPITAAELAAQLGLTAAGVRRHLTALEESGIIRDHHGRATSRRRGRPARAYVVVPGHQAARGPYARLALDALNYISAESGSTVVKFADAWFAGLLSGWARDIDADQSPLVQAEDLAAYLTTQGFAATLRPVGAGAGAHQLCQGACPIATVAARFPEFCEAETRAISTLLSTHVQRLATIAGGAHACVLHLPARLAPPNQTSPSDRKSRSVL